jgi:hypothetical protein
LLSLLAFEAAVRLTRRGSIGVEPPALPVTALPVTAQRKRRFVLREANQQADPTLDPSGYCWPSFAGFRQKSLFPRASRKIVQVGLLRRPILMVEASRAPDGSGLRGGSAVTANVAVNGRESDE